LENQVENKVAEFSPVISKKLAILLSSKISGYSISKFAFFFFNSEQSVF
jgi:hypothetical protein